MLFIRRNNFWPVNSERLCNGFYYWKESFVVFAIFGCLDEAKTEESYAAEESQYLVMVSSNDHIDLQI